MVRWAGASEAAGMGGEFIAVVEGGADGFPDAFGSGEGTLGVNMSSSSAAPALSKGRPSSTLRFGIEPGVFGPCREVVASMSVAEAIEGSLDAAVALL